MTIELYDYDDLFPNEFIGETTIDIEDRYFDNNWSKLRHKPIENRRLTNQDNPEVGAYCLMWLEVFPRHFKESTAMWDITPPPELVVIQ